MEAPLVPVQFSVLAAEALAEEALRRYPLSPPVRCRRWARGLNDTYRLDTGGETFYLRVAPHGWRTAAEIEAEVAAIEGLRARGLPVAPPVRRGDGAAVTPLLAPEGERLAVLFAPAPGEGVRDIGPAHARAYGRLAARVHDAFDAAPAADPRPPLDVRHLLDEPLAAIRATFGDVGEDLAYLEAAAERVRRCLAELPREAPAWGLCHGDLHPGNVLFGVDGGPTLFDFDCCGPGWRAYDLSVFLWNSYGERRPKRWRESRWRAFLAGYREVRPLPPEDLEAVPFFLVARHIWLTGMDCAGWTYWLPQWLNPAWFGEIVGQVRGWEAEYPILRPDPGPPG